MITFINEQLRKIKNPFIINIEEYSFLTVKVPIQWLEDKEKEFEYEITFQKEGKYGEFELGHADSRRKDAGVSYHVWLNPLVDFDKKIDYSIEYLVYKDKYKEWDKEAKWILERNGITKAKVQRAIKELELSEKRNVDFSNCDYVYLIQMEGTSFYKIGVSNNPNNRLKSLQTSSPVDLKIVANSFVSEAYRVENELHKKYKEKNTRNEWFILDEKDVSEIAKYLAEISIK